MSRSDYIKPRVPGGFRDLLPDEFAKRQKILDKTAEVYRSFGFIPLETSAVEHFESLAGGDETSKQIYRIFNHEPDLTGESLALRFDLTVSLARILAANRAHFNLPFKRYQIGYVWRGERQQKGRYKQFLQFDADIVGTNNIAADAEIVVIIDRVMRSLGVKNYTIRINSRKILNGFIRRLGISEQEVNPFLRILDKIDKIGWISVRELLAAKKLPAETVETDAEGLGLSNEQILKVERFITASGDNAELIKVIKDGFSASDMILAGLAEIETILNIIRQTVDIDKVQFTPALARGLDYYTGPVFETVLDDLPEIGSVMSGGRYDNLMERFVKESYPATGISLGVDRLVTALEELKLLDDVTSAPSVLFVPMTREADGECFKYAGILREQGVKCEVFLGENRKLKKQLNYANRRGIIFCIIIGEDELRSKRAQVKNMNSGEQADVEFTHLIEYLKKLSDI